MRKVCLQAKLLANIDVPVLILGESSTGKEVAARLIHKLSSRSQRKFLKVNCARRCPANCWKANCSDMSEVPLPALSAGSRASSNCATEAPFCWAKLASRPPVSRPRRTKCCGTSNSSGCSLALSELDPNVDSPQADVPHAPAGKPLINSAIETSTADNPSSLKTLVRSIKGETERNAIASTLEKTYWNRKQAARLLRISYRGLLYKIQQYVRSMVIALPSRKVAVGKATYSGIEPTSTESNLRDRDTTFP
jgi:hypothetical protein